jgi:hypothetical protein
VGFVPDLEVSSSAKKRKNSNWDNAKGQTTQNYDLILTKLLESLVKCQQNGGFDAYVRMGDKIQYLRVIPEHLLFKG